MEPQQQQARNKQTAFKKWPTHITDIRSAFEVLEIDYSSMDINSLTLTELKKQYYKQALLYHP